MRIFITAERLRVVSDSEVLVMFVTLDGDCKDVGIRSSIHLTEYFMEKYELFYCHTLHKYTSECLHSTVHIILNSNPEYGTINT